jgi:hypothetical protein
MYGVRAERRSFTISQDVGPSGSRARLSIVLSTQVLPSRPETCGPLLRTWWTKVFCLRSKDQVRSTQHNTARLLQPCQITACLWNVKSLLVHQLLLRSILLDLPFCVAFCYIYLTFSKCLVILGFPQAVPRRPIGWRWYSLISFKSHRSSYL